MKKKQFDVLYHIYENGLKEIEYIAHDLFLSYDNVKEICQYLEKMGYIAKNHITELGKKELEKGKIQNAIILAAGMSSRFVPLSFDLPKGLLRVKGEVLIERQICQLREKGIEEIVVVVGYMKEKFQYLSEKYQVILIETEEYLLRNNHSSIYAAKEYLKNTIITSSDLYFEKNIFQSHAYDAYYCTIYQAGKTAERGITTDEDDKIIKTFYGDRCCDIWVTLGYAYFSKRFSKKIIEILDVEYDKEQTMGKFWADIQDEHLEELYMYAKRCQEGIIQEFDSLEELRLFDKRYMNNSGSEIMKILCLILGVEESDIVSLQSLHKIKYGMFRFVCKEDTYICDIEANSDEKISYMGQMYYLCRDFNSGNICLYKLDKSIHPGYVVEVDGRKELAELLKYSKEFRRYHQEAVPLCAAENVLSPFANIPLSLGFQERYIMNNTYSFNMNDNFIGCEKLFPFYQKLSDVCGRIFKAKYVDARPFTGMNCIDMIVKTIAKAGDTIMILGSEYGGHASVKPVVERLGLNVIEAPYSMEKYDLEYEKVNEILEKEKVQYILIAPSDLIAAPDISKINISKTTVLYDCSQILGLIAAGMIENPLKQMENIIMFAGTHKTFPGPASGLILTNDRELHAKMETQINPKHLRHPQMHQKISLLFAMVEFEQFGTAYMGHMMHCANYLGQKLKSKGYHVAEVGGKITQTHQIFVLTDEELMNRIYDNAYKCKVTLNKKHKKLFEGYGIRLGVQEIARYDWNDDALDTVAEIFDHLAKKDLDIQKVEQMKATLPPKNIKYAFAMDEIREFTELLKCSMGIY